MSATTRPVRPADDPDAVIATMVARARAAQQRYAAFPQAAVDDVVLAAGWAIMEPARNRELAELAVSDTGLGDVADKIRKNHRKTLGLLRDGKQVNVNLELQQSSQNQVDSSSIFNGIEGAEMSNKGKDQGVVVNNVKTGTPAAQIGLKKGDVIIGANQQAVKNIAELRKVLDSKPSVLALNIQRGDSTIYLLMQ